ncbi:hypothetical protein VYU27_000487 [Nannochloropsis oceanica]
MLAFDQGGMNADMAHHLMLNPHHPHHHSHMLMDISETDREYRIEVDLPGNKKDDIDISVDDDVLTIQTERREESSEDQLNYHVKERRVGKSKRSIRLPKSADTDSIRAQYMDGVLRICVDKKTEKSQSKSVIITDHSYPFAK